MTATKQLHIGHRQRLFDRYAKIGLDGFSDIEVLELMLTYAIPRRDTNVLAHRLLDAFGSLQRVFEAPQDSLERVEGMTKRAALLIRLLPQLWTRYELCCRRDKKSFDTTEACGDFLLPFFRGLREERVRVLCLDAKCQLLDCREVSLGSVNSASMQIRRVVETALSVNASAVIVAHNHTSGIALPSKEDLEATERLKEALLAVDVLLIDHIIVADDDYVSLRDSLLL